MGRDNLITSSNSSESNRLIEAIEAGDQDAFKGLFERFSPALRQAIAARMDPRLRQRLDPSDILRETELQIYIRFEDYICRRPMPLQHWIWQTAQQCITAAWRHHIQAQQRSVDREQPFLDHSSRLVASLLGNRSAGSDLEHQELTQRLALMLTKLPEQDREILVLRRVEGLSNEETAVQLGISPAAAKKRFTRAVLRARTVLGSVNLQDRTLE